MPIGDRSPIGVRTPMHGFDASSHRSVTGTADGRQTRPHMPMTGLVWYLLWTGWFRDRPKTFPTPTATSQGSRLGNPTLTAVAGGESESGKVVNQPCDPRGT